MKNLMVANLRDQTAPTSDRITKALKAQIDNSLELGWSIDDLIVITNFDFSFLGVNSVKTELNKFCFTGSKMFGVSFAFKELKISDSIWAHDLDAWENTSINPVEFKDVGIATYSVPKFNGGSVFWKASSIDIINTITKFLSSNNAKKEEPTINKILKNSLIRDNVTVLNNTFNVGCSGFYERFLRADRPVRVCHFHPDNNIAWETFGLDRAGIGQKCVSDRLEKCLRKYYNLAIELSPKGKIARQVKIDNRKNV